MDGVVPEPEGGAHTNPAATAANVKTAIAATLNELLAMPVDDLLEARYRRFRMFGTEAQPRMGART